MDKLKTTILNLFNIAYRSRCSLPILISTAFMVLGFNLRLEFQFDAHPLEEQEELSEEEEEEEEEGEGEEDVLVLEY